VWGEHVAHDVPVDGDAERARDDARDPWATEPRMARLELDEGADACLARTRRAGLSRLRVRREEAAILATVPRASRDARQSRACGGGWDGGRATRIRRAAGRSASAWALAGDPDAARAAAA
jgi:hypothetical protein